MCIIKTSEQQQLDSTTRHRADDMKLHKVVKSDNAANSRYSEIYLLDSGRFEVFNMVFDQLSRGFPCKTYATEKAAVKYANKFIEA